MTPRLVCLPLSFWLTALCGGCSVVAPSAAVATVPPARLQPEFERDQPVRIPTRAMLPPSRSQICALRAPFQFVPILYVPPMTAERAEELVAQWEAAERARPGPVDALAPSILRVVDATSGRELDGIEFPFDPDADWQLDRTVRDPWLLRDATSPVDLRDLYLGQLQPRHLKLKVAAKGYAAQWIELDVLHGGTQAIELDPEAPLRVVVRGSEPHRSLVLRVSAADRAFPTLVLPLERDGELDVAGLAPGPTRVEIARSNAALEDVLASTVVDLQCDSATCTAFVLSPPCENAGSMEPIDDAAEAVVDWARRWAERPKNVACLRARCGTRVLEFPSSFELPLGSGLKVERGALDGLVLASDEPGLVEFRPPSIPGHRTAPNVLLEFRAGETLDYVLEYERVPRASGAASR